MPRFVRRQPLYGLLCWVGAAAHLLLGSPTAWSQSPFLQPGATAVGYNAGAFAPTPVDDAITPLPAPEVGGVAATAYLQDTPGAPGDRAADRTVEGEPKVPGDEETLDDPRITAIEKQLDEMTKKGKDAAKPKKDEFPTFKTTGFLQLDTAYYAQDTENRAAVGDAQDGTGFRRARFAVTGKVAEWTTYQLEVDFATAGRPSFFDCFVNQGNLPYFQDVKIGQFCQPFSIDSLTGFRNLPFLERSLPFLALVPFRRVGIQSALLSEDENSTLAYSLYRTGGFNNAPLGDDRFATDFGDVGGYSFASRGTHLLNYDEPAEGRYLWAVGASYTCAQLGANDAVGSGTPGNAGSPRPFYQARTTPEFGVLGYPENTQTFGSAVNGTPIFVDTGRYEANNFNLFGFETVAQSGPLSFQAEYMASIVQSVVGPVTYQGGYGQLLYRLTGEHRQYDKKLGVLKNPIPFTDFIPLGRNGICGWGAWEVAARYSIIDLRNPDSLDGHYYVTATNSFTGTSKAGNGVLQDTTLGFTWFLNKHTKIQGNWIHAMLDNTARGNSDADLFVSRVQVDY